MLKVLCNHLHGAPARVSNIAHLVKLNHVQAKGLPADRPTKLRELPAFLVENPIPEGAAPNSEADDGGGEISGASVGGGVIGASTACFLSRLSIEVIVVETAEVAAAASGKAGGFLALDWCAVSLLMRWRDAASGFMQPSPTRLQAIGLPPMTA